MEMQHEFESYGCYTRKYKLFAQAFVSLDSLARHNQEFSASNFDWMNSLDCFFFFFFFCWWIVRQNCLMTTLNQKKKKNRKEEKKLE